MSLILHETLGRTLPEQAQPAAAVWGLCHRFVQTYGEECVRRAGIQDQGAGIAEAMFSRIMESESGCLISVHDYEESWKFLAHKDGRIHLAVPKMFEEIEQLQSLNGDDQYPLTLMAGERRSYNANTIYREEAWRKKDTEGALKIHPDDAAAVDLADGGWARCESSRGEIDVQVSFTDEMRPGVVSLPHGYGLSENSESGEVRQIGPAINMLTSSDFCDDLAKTPFHKSVPVKLTPIAAPTHSTNEPVAEAMA